MPGRRGILKGLVGLLLAPLFGGLADGRPAAALPPGFRLVNGWILTERDVAALGGSTGAPIE